MAPPYESLQWLGPLRLPELYLWCQVSFSASLAPELGQPGQCEARPGLTAFCSLPSGLPVQLLLFGGLMSSFTELCSAPVLSGSSLTAGPAPRSSAGLRAPEMRIAVFHKRLFGTGFQLGLDS